MKGQDLDSLNSQIAFVDVENAIGVYIEYREFPKN